MSAQSSEEKLKNLNLYAEGGAAVREYLNYSSQMINDDSQYFFIFDTILINHNTIYDTGP